MVFGSQSLMLLSSQAYYSLVAIDENLGGRFSIAASYLNHLGVAPNLESVELAIIAIVNDYPVDLFWQLKLDHFFVTF